MYIYLFVPAFVLLTSPIVYSTTQKSRNRAVAVVVTRSVVDMAYMRYSSTDQLR